jgi:hypothetical protein
VCVCVCVCVCRGGVLHLFHAYYQWLHKHGKKILDHYMLRLEKNVIFIFNLLRVFSVFSVHIAKNIIRISKICERNSFKNVTWLNTVGIMKIKDATVGGAYITHEEIERR